MPENAASELRAVLPPGVAARLDLSLLRQVPGTFIDEALRQKHADLLFTAPMDGQDALVYVLVEHQSSSDPIMPWRMLRYIGRVWDRYLEENPRARKLPVVIPLVIHNGRAPWSAPVRLQDLIEPAPDGAEEYLPRFSFLLDDLAAASTGELRARDLTPATLLAMAALKDAPGNPRMHAVLLELAPEVTRLLNEPGGTKAFELILTYIWTVSETPGSEFARAAASLGPDAEKAYMTTAEMFEARGTVEGRAETLIEVLTARFGPLPEDLTRQVNEASISQLKKWTPLAATAATLHDVFA